MATKKIYEDDENVVYLRDEPVGVELFLHRKLGGKEATPTGYVPGVNSLYFTKLADKPEQA